MSRALVWIIVLGLAPILQGVLATFLPRALCPDLGLLGAVALGLVSRNVVAGLCGAALLGYLADLLSGSLLGQHVLLRLAAFGVARLASQPLNLRGGLPQMVFVGSLSAGNALATSVLTAFFASQPGLGVPGLGEILLHATVDGLCAPLAVAGVQRIAALLNPEESGRRLLRLEPRNWTA